MHLNLSNLCFKLALPTLFGKLKEKGHQSYIRQQKLIFSSKQKCDQWLQIIQSLHLSQELLLDKEYSIISQKWLLFKKYLVKS